MIKPPETDKRRDRLASETHKHIGYLKKDLPGKRGKVSAARKAGGKAYLKPNVTWDGFSIHYNLVDKNGAGVPSSSVVFKDAVTLRAASQGGAATSDES